MPSVNLMALTPFNKNKDIWNYFFKENIMATLMANGCDSAIFSDEVPPLPHPALSNNIQDQRDFITRVQKHDENITRLKERLSTGYAIISRLVTGPETRALIKQAEMGVPLNQEYRLRHLCRNIMSLMDLKYASNDLSLNAVLIGKWTAFRWTHRYGFNPAVSSDPRDSRYTRIEEFAVDFNIAVDEYSIFDPVTTNNQLAMVQLLLTKLTEFEGIREAVKIAASRGATTATILETLIRQEAFGLHSPPAHTVAAVNYTRTPQQKTFPSKTNFSSSREEKSDEVKCYNCAKGGHLAKDCKSKFCRRCNIKISKWYVHHLIEGDCKQAGTKRVAAVALTEETEESETDDIAQKNSFSTGNLFNQFEEYLWQFILQLLLTVLHFVQLEKYSGYFSAMVIRTVTSAFHSDSGIFLLDSGADISICNGDYATRIGDPITVEGITGKSSSENYVDVGEYEFLHLPRAVESVLSVKEVVQRGHTVQFSPAGVKIQDSDGNVLVSKRGDGLCFLEEKEVKVLRTRVVINEHIRNQCMYIHLRQGHASAEAMCRSIESRAWIETGLTTRDIRAVFRYDPCIDCAVSKMRRGDKGKSDGIIPRVGAILSVDWIPCSIVSIDGHKGFFYMVDVGTGAIYAYPALSKTAKEFKKILLHHLLIMTRLGQIVTTLHSDYGSTETSQEIREVLQRVGIKPEECNVRRQENNTIESYVVVCTRGVAAILMGLPWHHPSLWNFALTHFCDVNRTIPNTKSGERSPAQILEGWSVNCDRHFKFPYGTILACVMDKNSKFGRRDTFENGLIGFVVGYDHNKINDDGIIVYLPSQKTTETFKRSDVKLIGGDPKEQLKRLNIDSLPPAVKLQLPQGTQRRIDFSHIETTLESEKKILRDREIMLNDLRKEDLNAEFLVGVLKIATATDSTFVQHIETVGAVKRKIHTDDNPTLKKIMNSDELFLEWKDALLAELNGLAQSSLQFIPESKIPKNANVYDSMVVTTTKRSNIDNKLERRKCRLVIRGDQQKTLLIDNIFSPTVSRQSFILLVILAAQYDMHLIGFDVTQAFLNSEINGDVFVRLPSVLFQTKNSLNLESQFAKLTKSVYGLKEAPRMWYDNISATLQSIGFKKLASDICVFIRGSFIGNNFVIIALTVDDGAIAACNEEDANQVITKLESTYKITKQEVLTSYAGFNIQQTSTGYYVNQPAYIETLSDHIAPHFMDIFNQIKSYQSPIDEKIFDTFDINVKRHPTEREYKELLGATIYCLPTQPGIAFAIQILATRSTTHTVSDYIRLLRLVKYLQNDASRGLNITWSRYFNLTTYCDSSFLLDPETSASFFCYIIKLGNNLLTICSKKIKGVMCSSTEAEQWGIFELAKQVEFWRFYLSEIQHTQMFPTTIYQDNISAITISKNIDKNFKKVKYFLMRINKINHLVAEQIVNLIWLDSINQLADIGTKSTGPTRFKFLDERIRGEVQQNFSENLDVDHLGV